MNYSGRDIKRLGESINVKQGKIDNDELELLQQYRKSFTEPLTETFSTLTLLKSKVNRGGIIAFRLKRIKTIINKALRNPKMNLYRMGDIAGIRIILENEQQLFKMSELIQENFEVSEKIRDYVSEPKPIGYKGIHIYIKDKKFGKRIEIQLRTVEYHNWSTLVEITDLLCGTRLKELGYENNRELGEFHSLISSDIQLNQNEANHIYKVLEKYDYIMKLSKTFRKNHAKVKEQWLAVKPRSRYFLIESSSTEVPTLQGYTDYDKAEEEYFKRYKQDQEALVVLTSIQKPSFEQISIAYANYILSYHKFISDIEPIIKELALEAIEMKKFFRFRKIFKTYEKLQANAILDIFTSAEGIIVKKIDSTRLEFTSPKKISTKKRKELRRSLDNELKGRSISHRRFMKDIFKQIEDKKSSSFVYKRFLKRHSKRVKKHLKNLTIEFN